MVLFCSRAEREVELWEHPCARLLSESLVEWKNKTESLFPKFELSQCKLQACNERLMTVQAAWNEQHGTQFVLPEPIPSEELCVICQQFLLVNYSHNMLSCGHRFHSACIALW